GAAGVPATALNRWSGRERRDCGDGFLRGALGVATATRFVFVRAVGAHVLEAVVAAVLLALVDRARAVRVRTLTERRKLFGARLLRVSHLAGFHRRLLVDG